MSLIANTYAYRISGITDGWTFAGVFALVLLADRLFSFKRKVKILGKENNAYNIELDYSKVILNEPQSIPFNVSDKYEVVK